MVLDNIYGIRVSVNHYQRPFACPELIDVHVRLAADPNKHGDQALGISVPRSTVRRVRARAADAFLQRRPRGIRSRRLQCAFRMNLAADLFHAIADCLPVNIQAI
jgi:hypothetical protein